MITVTGLDVVARCDDFEATSEHVQLRPWQWQLLHTLDGRTELRDVATACGVGLDAAIALVQESEASGMVRVVALSLDEFRKWNWTHAANASVAQPVAAAEPGEAVVTHDDHFSNTDVLAELDRSVPAWMIEPSPPIEYEHEPVLEDDDVVESAEEPEFAHVAEAAPADEYVEYEPVVATGHAEFADLLADPVAHEGHATEDIAEPVTEPVAEHVPDDAALAFMHEEATASQAVADLVARHHETSYSEHEYFTSSTAPEVEAEPETVAEPVAEYAPESTSDYAHEYAPAYIDEYAAEAAAELEAAPVAESGYTFEPVAEAEYAPEPVAEAGYAAEPVAEVEHAAEPAHTNGRSAAWEPMTLVTHVDEDHTPLENDSYRDPSMPEGVSIWLSHGTPNAGYYEPELEEKGSVSFSLSPDDALDDHPAANPPVDSAPLGHAATTDVPVAAEPQAQPAQDVAGVFVAAKEPSNGHIEKLPAAEPPAATTTADIVGSLISRALTFRIK